ncbi:uncharacterized protein LOC118151263 isoform X2 [Callithrix jacchus]
MSSSCAWLSWGFSAACLGFYLGLDFTKKSFGNTLYTRSTPMGSQFQVSLPLLHTGLASLWLFPPCPDSSGEMQESLGLEIKAGPLGRWPRSKSGSQLIGPGNVLVTPKVPASWPEALSSSTRPEPKSGCNEVLRSGLSGAYAACGTQPPSRRRPCHRLHLVPVRQQLDSANIAAPQLGRRKRMRRRPVTSASAEPGLASQEQPPLPGERSQWLPKAAVLCGSASASGNGLFLRVIIAESCDFRNPAGRARQKKDLSGLQGCPRRSPRITEMLQTCPNSALSGCHLLGVLIDIWRSKSQYCSFEVRFVDVESATKCLFRISSSFFFLLTSIKNKNTLIAKIKRNRLIIH